MFFAENLKRTIYVASRSVNENGVFVYSQPTEYRVNCHNVLPTSASADLVTVGTSIFDYLQILGDPDYLSNIKQFDKVYVDVQPPAQSSSLAATADYIVESVIPYPTVTKITIRRLVVE